MKSAAKNDGLIRELCKDPNYLICRDGSILTKIQKTGKISKDGSWRALTPKITTDGYVCYRYKYHYLRANRIIYQAFIGELDCLKQVNHRDGIRSNNFCANLELTTQSENMRHAFDYLGRKASIPFSKNARPELHIGGQ